MVENNQQDNIVSIADARKRQKVVRKGGNGKDPNAPKKNGPGQKIWMYLQFVIFLAIVGYFMQKCRG